MAPNLSENTPPLTGVLAPDDSSEHSELHFKPFRVLLGRREDTGATVIRRHLFEGDEPLAA